MLTGPGEPARPDTWKRDITSGNVSGHTIASTLGPLALSSLPDTGMAPRFQGLLNPLAKCCFPSPRSPALHCPPGAPGRGASGGAAVAAGGQEFLRQGPAQTPAWRRTALQQLPPARAQRELCVQSLGALIRRPRPGPTAPRAPGASRRSPNAQSANLQAPPQQRRTHLAPPPPASIGCRSSLSAQSRYRHGNKAHLRWGVETPAQGRGTHFSNLTKQEKGASAFRARNREGS